MKKIISVTIALLMLSFVPLSTSAGDLTTEQQRMNAIESAIQSVVKINPSLTSTGSGFFISTDKVLTNFHVAFGSGSSLTVTITKYDGTNCTGKVTYRDERSDLALIEHTTCSGTPLKLAKSVRVGQDLYAIGSPTPLSYIVTSGIVSKVERASWKFDAVITDAQAQNGNSGGPMINSDGELIAVTKAIVRDVPYLTVGIGLSEVESFLRRAGVDYGHSPTDT